MNILQFLQGKKTYITGVIAIILLIGQSRGWWQLPKELYEGLAALAVIFLRAGVNASSSSSAGGTPQGSGQSVPIKNVLPLLLVAGVGSTLLIGCGSLLAPVAPDADPLVVNVERGETTAKATFDLVLHVDDQDRGFWRTNAPAFHGFCEWLRQPQTVDRTNALPRCSAMLWSLDDVKNAYRQSRASSNDLWTAWSTLSSAANQAGAWLTIVTNNPPQLAP